MANQSSNGTLAKRYARALFSLASELKNTEEIKTQLETVVEVMTANEHQLLNVLTTPLFKLEERKNVLTAVIEKMALTAILSNFLQLLLDNHRISLLQEISVFYQGMADAIAGRIRAVVHTAQEISEQEKLEIQSTLAKSMEVTVENLVIHFEVKPEIIGGIFAKIGDRTYDATIRSKLQDMTTALMS